MRGESEVSILYLTLDGAVQSEEHDKQCSFSSIRTTSRMMADTRIVQYDFTDDFNYFYYFNFLQVEVEARLSTK